MRRYETLFILHPDLPEAQVRETLDRVRRLIESMQGQAVDLHEWGMRELAYPIAKQARGIYVLAQYSARPEVVKELERMMKLSDEFLRFVSVRMTEKGRSGRPGASGAPRTAVDEAASAEQGS